MGGIFTIFVLFFSNFREPDTAFFPIAAASGSRSTLRPARYRLDSKVFSGEVGWCAGVPSAPGEASREFPLMERFLMKDDKGRYYHPDPSDAGTRVYVRQGAGGVEFRLWRSDRPDVWEKHDWLAHDVVAAAAAMYRERGGGADPLRFYDLNVARALVKDEERKLVGR